MEGAKCKVWSVRYGVESVKYNARSTKCRVCAMQSVKRNV